MGKNVTVYLDSETVALLDKSGKVNVSKILRRGIKDSIKRAKELNLELDQLPSEDDMRDTFKHLLSIDEVLEQILQMKDRIKKLEGEE